MFNNETLSALKDLKADIRTARNVQTGTVRGTLNKFGFVQSESGEQYFLSGSQMDELLPEDVIDFVTQENKRGDQEAVFETLKSSSLKDIYGRVHLRGQHVFVEADLPNFNRWFFVPPKLRKGATDGDLVKTRLVKHPKNLGGKSQVSIEKVLGKHNDADAFANYVCTKSKLTTTWPKKIDEQVASVMSKAIDQNQRSDQTTIPFVTIDSRSTRDIDDAIFAERDGDNINVKVAIADPWEVVRHEPKLATDIIKRASSHYLQANTLHMMPEELIKARCSLVEGEERAALIISFTLDANGNRSNDAFELATIKSQGQLAYDDVDQILGGALESEHKATLDILNEAATKLSSRRKSDCVSVHTRPDFKFKFNDNHEIESIMPAPKSVSRQLVEELMIATNRSAAAFLIEHNVGVFTNHQGFRTERIGDFKKLTSHYWGEEKDAPKSVAEFVTLMHDAVQMDADVPLRSVMTRWMQPSLLSTENLGHFGQGFDAYCTITSPIRKAGDLINHAFFHSILRNDKAYSVTDELLANIQDTLKTGRQAVNQIEAKLKFDFAKKALEKSKVYAATVSHVNNRGIIVRLDDTGIEGFIDLKAVKKKAQNVQFDNWRLAVSIDNDFYHLDQIIEVELDDIDETRQAVNFKLA